MSKNLLTKTPFDPSPYRQRVEELFSKMTLEEKIGQLNLEADPDLKEFAKLTEGNTTAEIKPNTPEERVAAGKVGGFLLGNRKEAIAIQHIAVERSRLGIPLLFGWDVIHGRRTIFPVPLGAAAGWDMDNIEACERCAAKEAYAFGINWVYAPMIDLCRDPRWGRVAEGAGEDPLLGSLVAQAKVRGFQTINPVNGYPYVAACFKHYCGYGLSMGGRDYDEGDISPRTLFGDYMKPYEAAVNAGAMSCMSSFNSLNGEPVSGSRYYCTDVLRGRYGFGGFVVSDWDSVAELIHHRVAADRKDAARKGITAGVDFEMNSGTYLEYCGELYDTEPAVKEAVDESVKRILGVKFALGLFDDPYREDEADQFINSAEARAVARKSARECMVLLKNSEATLPLSKDKKYFLTGPLSANESELPGAWADYHPNTNVYSVYKAMKERGIDLIQRDGCPFREGESEYEKDFSSALQTAAECDEIIFVCGERGGWSGENRGCVTLDLQEVQMRYLRALKKLGKPIVSVLMCGRAMSCVELDALSDALLLAWHSGTETGNGVCDLLFGDYSPSGRLPITFPYYTGQIPFFHSRLSSGRSRKKFIRYKDGENKPLYPFGYGLSYADITYSCAYIENPMLKDGEALIAGVKLTNNSDIPALEVVQAYFRDVVCTYAPPEKKLCAFDKVLVPAHGSVDVRLEIPFERFAVMTGDLREIVERGDFKLYIGHDSDCCDCEGEGDALDFEVI